MDSGEKRTALFLTGELSLGGGAMFVLNLCEGLRDLGGEWSGVAGVFSNLGNIGDQMRERGLQVIGPFEDALLHEDYIESMHAECDKLQPDAVVANLGGDAYDFMRFVPEGVLRIGVIHSDRDNVYRLVEAYKPWLDVVVAVSRHAANHFKERNASDDLLVTSVSCGIPISEAARKPSGNGKLRVLYLGRLEEEQKRVRMMSRIIRRSVAADAGIEWTLIGDGPQLPEIREELSDLKDSVHLEGSISYSEVKERLPDFDVYFLCSDYEGLPLSMLEAMSAGLVPVVSDLPSGISEVVHVGNGIRVDMSDEEGYVKALLDLAQSPDRLEAMSAQARVDVKQEYSVPAMSRRWQDLLSAEVKSGKPAWELKGPVTLPPISVKRWFHHPALRTARRFLKGLKKGVKGGSAT